MILWHLGLAAALVYVTLGRRRIDYRYVLLGAVLPDVVDAVLGVFAYEGPNWRGAAHSFLAPVAVAIAIVVVFRGERRVAVFGLSVGWLLHLVGDGMWEAPRTFLWPLFGLDFAALPREPYSWALFTDPGAHWALWLGEVAGFLFLAWFWAAFRLGHEDRWRLFLRDGYLRP